jgi:hypothetical protein
MPYADESSPAHESLLGSITFLSYARPLRTTAALAIYAVSGDADVELPSVRTPTA